MQSTATARAEPLLPVKGREVAHDVAVRGGVIHVKFGFRVRTSAKRLWKIVGGFKRYPKYVDGLKKVKVRRQGRAHIVRLEGSLLSDYRIQVRARTSYGKGAGRVRWTVIGEEPPSHGEMRVDPDGDQAVFSLATSARKGVELPNILVEVGLRAAILAIAESLRGALEGTARPAGR